MIDTYEALSAGNLGRALTGAVHFHEFMLDAPEAAMVAVALWAILVTERFSRLGASALADVAVGLGMLSKETFVFFIAGVALVTLTRGGRRAWRGFTVSTVVALVIAVPWYVYELTTIHGLALRALGSLTTQAIRAMGIAPPRFSRANLEWYFWSILNRQLFLPLFAFTVVGASIPWFRLFGGIRSVGSLQSSRPGPSAHGR